MFHLFGVYYGVLVSQRPKIIRAPNLSGDARLLPDTKWSPKGQYSTYCGVTGRCLGRRRDYHVMTLEPLGMYCHGLGALLGSKHSCSTKCKKGACLLNERKLNLAKNHPGTEPTAEADVFYVAHKQRTFPPLPDGSEPKHSTCGQQTNCFRCPEVYTQPFFYLGGSWDLEATSIRALLPYSEQPQSVQGQ